MGAEDSVKKLRRNKMKKKRIEQSSRMENSQATELEENLSGANNKKIKKKKKPSGDVLEKVSSKPSGLSDIGDETQEPRQVNKKSEELRNKKRKTGKEVPENETREGKFLRKKKRKGNRDVKKVDDFEEQDVSGQKNGGEIGRTTEPIASSGLREADIIKSSKTGKQKKAAKMKKKRVSLANFVPQDNLTEKQVVVAEDEVYDMSSGDEDYSKGMQKWIMQYHQSRPGLKVLQERIDDFIVAHEAQEEQARKEREAQAAEGGWTVVVHHKGRKKTTDAESGIAVGSVAQAAVLDKTTKKKNKEVGLDFYRFQKREAHRSELMMLQSKFEQDKKRIQQMRAARKFRPY